MLIDDAPRAAFKKDALSAAEYQEMIASMTMLNRIGAELGHDAAAHVIADVTCEPEHAAGLTQRITAAGHPHARMIGNAAAEPPSVTVGW
jgi:hypothetical protein